MDPAVRIEPLAVKQKTAAALLECGLTKVWELVCAGKLEVIYIGKDKRIKVESLRRLIAEGGAPDVVSKRKSRSPA
jgi:hypothetical protein